MPINPIISICFFVTLHFFTLASVIIIDLPHVYGFNFVSLKALVGSLVPLLFPPRNPLLFASDLTQILAYPKRQALLLIIPGDVPFVGLLTHYRYRYHYHYRYRYRYHYHYHYQYHYEYHYQYQYQYWYQYHYQYQYQYWYQYHYQYQYQYQYQYRYLHRKQY